MPFILKAFQQLSLDELYGILQLRSEVFVLEQQSVYLDCDSKDQASWHLFCKRADGEILAACRLLPPGLNYAEASIGRVVVRPGHRGNGLARAMMEQAIEKTGSLFKTHMIRISGQHYLESFYQSLGFRTESAIYLEDGIPHVSMIKKEDDEMTESTDRPAPAAVHEPRIRLWYLDHSAFLIQTSARLLLFDYGSMPARPAAGNLDQGVLNLPELPDLPLYAFSSHRHGDHYDAALAETVAKRANSWFVLGEDAPTGSPRKIREKQVIAIGPHQRWILNDCEILTSASTDQGVSFMLHCPELSLYFGGDLACWDDTPEFRNGHAREINWLSDQNRLNAPPYLAMIPVSTSDGYQDDCLLEGARLTLQKLHPKVVIPMHAHGYEHFYARFSEWIRQQPGLDSSCEIRILDKPGKHIEI